VFPIVSLHIKLMNSYCGNDNVLCFLNVPIPKRKASDQMGNLHTPDISHVPIIVSCMFQIHVFIYQIKVFNNVIWSRSLMYLTMRKFCCCYAIHVVNTTFAIFTVCLYTASWCLGHMHYLTKINGILLFSFL